MTKNKIALIHHTDVDGMMSGYLLELMFQPLVEQRIAKLFAYSYQKDAEWMNDTEFTVFIFGDVVPTIDWLKKAEINNFDVTILDHHKQKYLEITKQFHFVKYIFDETKSGCKIIADWTKNNYGPRIDYLIRVINDYDLWLFDSPGYDTDFKGDLLDKETVLELNTYFQMFNTLESFKNVTKAPFDAKLATQAGNVLIQKTKNDNEHMIRKGVYFPKTKLFLFAGYPNYWTLGQIKEKYPEMEYWCGFEIKLQEKSMRFSLKSESGKKDNCHLIAKKFDGGGHPNASGFVVTLEAGLDILRYADDYFDITIDMTKNK